MPKGGIKIINQPSSESEDLELELERPVKKSKKAEIPAVQASRLPKKTSAPKQPAKSPEKRTEPTEKTGLLKKLDNLITKFSTIPLSEKLFFADHFRVMVKAGLSITEALETLAMQTKNKKFKRVLFDIKEGVTKGGTLGGMLEQYPKVFPEYFINMIKVGELSGNLENNLEQLAIQMKKDHDLVSKVKGAMIYPAVIVVATFGIGILMFVYVIPTVLSIFDELKIQLPLATRILIAISKFINSNGILVLVGIFTFIAGMVILSRTQKGRRDLHFILLNLWIVGPIVKKINLARFARTLSSLLKTDIPVIESFKITSTVLGNVFYKDQCQIVSSGLAEGVSINGILAQSPRLFPPIVTQMILVGEKSGSLDELLGELAIFYEEEVSDITKNLSSIIEPILIVFLGGVVGLIAFAVISPIYSLTEAM